MFFSEFLVPRRIVTRGFSAENILLSTVDSVVPKSVDSIRLNITFEEHFVRV